MACSGPKSPRLGCLRNPQTQRRSQALLCTTEGLLLDNPVQVRCQSKINTSCEVRFVWRMRDGHKISTSKKLQEHLLWVEMDHVSSGGKFLKQLYKHKHKGGLVGRIHRPQPRPVCFTEAPGHQNGLGSKFKAIRVS